MLLKSLELHDFRQYKGTQKIVFATDPDKNVTVLLGNNTMGKTTLLQAFSWVLYGKVSFPDDSNPKMLLNFIEAEEMEGSKNTCKVWVKLELVHEDTEYIIIRTQDFKNKKGSQWIGEEPSNLSIQYKDADGKTGYVKKEKASEVIKNMLPESLKDYFFFDTERVGNISSKKDVADAVGSLLGLAPLKNAYTHLGERDSGINYHTINKMYKKLNLEKSKEVEKAQHQIDELAKTIQGLSERRRSIKKELEEIDKQIQKNQDVIRQNDETKHNQDLIDQYQKNNQELRKRLTADEKDFFDGFQKTLYSYALDPLVNKANQILQDSGIGDKGIIDMTGASINELVKRGYCICGAPIRNGNEAYKHLMEAKSFLPPASIGTEIKNLKSIMKKEVEKGEGYYKSALSKKKSIDEIRNSITDNEDLIEKLREENKQKPDIRVYEENVTELENEKEKLIREDGGIENELLNKEKEKKEKQIIVNRGLEVTKESQQILKEIAYAEAIRDWMKDNYEKKAKEMRENLEKKVNEVFAEMSHQNRIVEISPKYEVTLYDIKENGEKRIPGESEGLKRVKNFSFIAGLVEIAKQQILYGSKETGYLEFKNESYPLVMDAPFSNTDEEHITKISGVLPRAANQVIMFVMEKDWQYARRVLMPRVGELYQLVKKDKKGFYTEIEKDGD